MVTRRMCRLTPSPPKAGSIAVVLLAGCGGSHPQTAVCRCATAYQAYVNDVAILNAAHAACDGLSAAQARQAGEDVQP
jgi:hypothetical protein